MPVCKKCHTVAASAEMRRSPKHDAQGFPEWLCKDQWPCKARVKANKRKVA